MAYNLPPISTLSAALASQPVPIAPELMGVEGLPPRRITEYDESGPPNHQAPSYGGYQPSAAREDGGAEFAYAQPSPRSAHPHEALYQDHSLARLPPARDHAEEDGLDPHPKPRKRQKVTRPRALENDSPTELGLERGQEAEYEYASHDAKTGPIFVHPPKGAAQACVRCHRIKRKCDNARPRCAGCGKANVACVFELSPAASTSVPCPFRFGRKLT